MNHQTKKKIAALLTVSLSAFLLTNVGASNNDTTYVKVEFQSGQGPTKPVDPEDLTDIDTPDEVFGDLVIVSVSDFIFSATGQALVVTQEDQSYPILTTQPNTQVVDLRGTNKGWVVQAYLDEFTNDGEPSLLASTITITNGRPHSLSMNITPPAIAPDIELIAGETTPINMIKADKGSGMGLWVMRWYPENILDDPYVHLNVPAGSATRGANISTITWILKNAD